MQKNIELALRNTDRCVHRFSRETFSRAPPPPPPPPPLCALSLTTSFLPPYSIEDIDDKATVLADSANKFKNAGGQLKRQMQCRLIKIYLFFGIIITAVLAGIIAYFVYVHMCDKTATLPHKRLTFKATPHSLTPISSAIKIRRNKVIRGIFRNPRLAFRARM